MALLLFYFLTLAGIICCQEVIKMRVKEDENVILPCSLDSTNIRAQTFDWEKDDQKKVFFYSSGSHYNNGRGGQDPQFKGRVFHFEDQLQSGNASIVIRKTKKTDSGNYSCIFPFRQPTIRSIIELLVDCTLKDRTEEKIAGSSPKPCVTILGQTDGQALLQCEVLDVFPKPKVQWLDSENKTVPAEEPQVTESEGKYIILNATVTKSGVYRCVSTQEEICHRIDRKIEVYVHEFAYGLFVAVAISDAVLLLIYGILLVLKICDTVKWFKELYYGLLVAAVVSGAIVVILLAVFVKETCTRINRSTEHPYELLVAVTFFSAVLLLIYGILLVPKLRIFFIKHYKLYYGLLVAAVVSGAIVVVLLAVFVTPTCTRINCWTGSFKGLIVVFVLGFLLVLIDIFQQIITIVKQDKDKDPDCKPWIFLTDKPPANPEAGQQNGPQQPMMSKTDAGAELKAERAKLEAERAKLEAERAKLEAERDDFEAKPEEDTTDKDKSGNHEENILMSKTDGNIS